MNGKDSDLTMEMLARGLTRAASGAAKDIDAEQNANILGSFSSFSKRRSASNYLLYLMITLFLLFIRFLPWGSSSSTGAGDSREALLCRVTLDDRPAAPETHLCLG